MDREELLKQVIELDRGVRELRDRIDTFIGKQPSLIRETIEQAVGVEAAQLLYGDRAHAMSVIRTKTDEHALHALAVLIFHWQVDDELVRECMSLARDSRHDLRTRQLAVAAVGKGYKAKPNQEYRDCLSRIAHDPAASPEMRECAVATLGGSKGGR